MMDNRVTKVDSMSHHKRMTPCFSSGKGQSLVEMVLAMVVLVPIMVSVGFGGMVMYQGTMASEAIKEPATAKNRFAGRSGAIPVGELRDMANTGGGGNGALDSVTISAPVLDDVVLLVGRKKSMTIPLINLDFDFSVAQPIQRNLLLANTGRRSSGPNEAPPNLNGVPGPPSDDPEVQKHNPPPTMECNPPGVTIMVGMTKVNSLYGNAPVNTYKSRTDFPNIPVRIASQGFDTFLNSGEVKGACAGKDAGVCGTENSNLQPKEHTAEIFSEEKMDPKLNVMVPHQLVFKIFENPPGAPGQKLEIGYNDLTGQEIKNYSELYGPPHGLYFDGGNTYIQPPGDFVASCTKRKEAECQVKEAAKAANEFYDRVARAACEDN